MKKLFRFSSKEKTHRVENTMNGVSDGMNIDMGTQIDVEDDRWKKVNYYRNHISMAFSSDKLPQKFRDELDKWKKLGLKENEIFKEFLEGKREVKPITVAEDFIKMVWMIFKRASRKDEKITVVSFRHWDKNPDWTLSEKWKIQSQELWKRLKDELNNGWDNNWETILVATHNVFNETLINTMFSDVEDVEIPKERKNLLNFTETVKYTFYPNKEELDKSYLVVDWRGFKRQISYKNFYEKFKEILEGKEDKEAVEKSD